jgi:hypothetical protein
MDTTSALEQKRERVLEQMRAIRCMRRGSVTGKDGRTTTEPGRGGANQEGRRRPQKVCSPV